MYNSLHKLLFSAILISVNLLYFLTCKQSSTHTTLILIVPWHSLLHTNLSMYNQMLTSLLWADAAGSPEKHLKARPEVYCSNPRDLCGNTRF